MKAAISMDEIALNERAALFEGRRHGGGVSFFDVRFARGEGPPLHRHPYDETFLVLEGTARFTVGDETLEVGAGHVVVAPAGVTHAFVGAGDGVLHVVALAPTDRVVTEPVD